MYRCRIVDVILYGSIQLGRTADAEAVQLRKGRGLLLGLPSNFAEDRFARLGGLNCWIVTVPYFLNKNFISDCNIGFPILGFIRGFHTQNIVSIFM